MIQPGFFDLDYRLRKIDSTGDPLAKIENWFEKPGLRYGSDGNIIGLIV